MKRGLFLYSLLATIITATYCCSDDGAKEGWHPELVTKCFMIVDSETGLPIIDANLTIQYNYLTTAATAFYGASDVNGQACGEIYADARPYYWKITKENYQPICNSTNSFPPEVINLKYESYMKFEIENEAPFSEQDNIVVSYKDLSCFGFNDIILYGAAIDTVLIRVCSPDSPSYINVESIGANPFTDLIQVNVSSRDTTTVSIIY